jgi:hypothetical protein
MRLYLDEDIAAGILCTLLQKAGHDVQTPADVGLAGRWDPIQLRNAIEKQRLLLSYNYADFEDLHFLVQAAKGMHPGIIVVRREKDPRKNMSVGDIVRALRKLEGAGLSSSNQYFILNHWK